VALCSSDLAKYKAAIIMNILFVCHHLPYALAPHSGGLDVYHYMASLSTYHEVSLVSFVTPQEMQYVDSLRPLCRHIRTIQLDRSWKARLGRGLLRVVYPMQYGHTLSLTYYKELRQLAEMETFDVVHCVAPWMAQYRQIVPNAAWVLDEVDIYSQVAWQIYQQARNIKRLYAGFEWRKLERYELRICRQMDAIVVRSPYDRIWLQARVPGVQIEVLPPWFEGLDALLQIPAIRPPGNDVLFMGAMNRPPNVEAVLKFVRDVLPLVQAKVPNVHLWIVGGNPRPEILRLRDYPNVRVTGYVKDLTEFYQRAAVVIAPLSQAGGIIVKVLNGMAAARPVVATSVANRGIAAEVGKTIMIADDAFNFAAAIVELLYNLEHWNRLAQAGRQFIQENYAWSKIIQNLESLYSAALTRKRRS